MDKTNLGRKIQALEGLSNEEKTALLELIRGHKKYGLVWEDKPEDIEERLREDLPVLVERNDEKVHPIISDNPEAPNHLIIEGDNLAALTELSYTHAGRIDVIYIDPPYNTGKKDFVYNDTFIDREDSFRHSKWISFMAKRLSIAHGLLSPKGVIFLSIDDNEQADLKLLCDEIFGESNFLGQLILKTATDNNPSQINIEHEYMLCYCSSKALQGNWQRQSQAAKLLISIGKELLSKDISLDEAQKQLRKWIKANKELLPQVAHYNNIDEKGVYSSSGNSSNPHPGGYTYDIFHPLTNLPCPKPANGWRWPEETFLAYDRQGEIEWGKDHNIQPHVKKRIETSMEYLRTLIYEDNRGTTKALADIFGGEKRFDNPKPQTVLSRIIDFASDKSDIILDFFAGSGTTLHAVMQLNAEDGGTRTCILCTNNENGICENVTYERNKRVIKGYAKPNGEEVAGLTDNNLRYYRTEFLPRERSVKNMRELVQASTGLLCIKNDLYTEAPFGGRKMNPRYARYFASHDSGCTRASRKQASASHSLARNVENNGQQMLVIYEEQAIPFIADIIKTMPEGEKIKVYVFSHGSYAYNDEFAEVADRVTLCALPQAIYDAYQKVLPKRKPKFLVDDLVEEIVAIDTVALQGKEHEAAETQATLDFGTDDVEVIDEVTLLTNKERGDE
ncbi:MAG: site-specific DNA-methyltransferase [Muribaculaceae bacterium]|nr:site-specific DNA-methyltransferase [Muribaculaceae bacterium]